MEQQVQICQRCKKNDVTPPNILCDECYNQQRMSEQEPLIQQVPVNQSADESRTMQTTQPTPPETQPRTVEAWREERNRVETEKLNRIMDALQNILCVLIPLLGAIWVAFYFALAETLDHKNAPKMKLRGAICAAYMLVGALIGIICWKLWGFNIMKSLMPAWNIFDRYSAPVN